MAIPRPTFRARPFARALAGILTLAVSLSTAQTTGLKFLQNNRFTSYRMTSIVASPNGVHVFASGIGDSTAVYTLGIQPDGTLQFLGNTVLDASGAPALLGIHPAGDYVFAAFQQGYNIPTKIVAYSASAAGVLTLSASLNESNLANPTSLVVDPTGSFLYVLRGQLAVYAISATGGLSLVTDYAASGISGASIALSPDGRTAVVAKAPVAGGKGKVYTYRRDLRLGTLNAVAVDSASTATSSPRHVVALSNGFFYVSENSGMGIDSISRFAADTSGRLFAFRPATAVPTFSDNSPPTAGPYLAGSASGSSLFATGYLNDGGAIGTHPGYVNAYSVNANGSLTLRTNLNAVVSGLVTGGITSNSITVDPYGQYVYISEYGNLYGYTAINAFDARSGLDPAGFISRGPVVSFNRDSLALSDSLLLNPARLKAAGVTSGGFRFFRVGFGPDGSVSVPTINAPLFASPAFGAGAGRIFRAATTLPPKSPHVTLPALDSAYVAYPFIDVKSRYLYGPGRLVSAKPFVRLRPLSLDYYWARGGAISFSGALWDSRPSWNKGFQISNTRNFSGTRYSLPGASDFSGRIYRDTLGSLFTLKYPAQPLDTFYVRAWAVYGADTLWGDSTRMFTNAPAVAMRVTRVTSDTVVFVSKYQPWIFSGNRILEILKWTGPSNSNYTILKSCYNDSPCAVTGLTRGTYQFKARVRDQSNGNFNVSSRDTVLSIP